MRRELITEHEAMQSAEVHLPHLYELVHNLLEQLTVHVSGI